MFFKVVLQEPSPRKGREEEEEEVTTALSDNSEPPAGAHHFNYFRADDYFLHCGVFACIFPLDIFARQTSLIKLENHIFIFILHLGLQKNGRL